MEGIENEIQRWVEATSPILEAVSKRTEEGRKSGLIRQNFRVPCDEPVEYLGTLSSFYEQLEEPNKPEYCLRPREFEVHEVVEVISERVEGGSIRIRDARGISMLLHLNEEIDWKGVLDAMEGRINTYYFGGKIEQIDPDEFGGLFGTLLVLVYRGELDSAKNLLKQSTSTCQAALGHSQGHPVPTATSFLSTLISGGPEKEDGQVSQNVQKWIEKRNRGGSLARKLAKSPVDYHEELSRVRDVMELTAIDFDRLSRKTTIDLSKLEDFC